MSFFDDKIDYLWINIYLTAILIVKLFSIGREIIEKYCIKLYLNLSF